MRTMKKLYGLSPNVFDIPVCKTFPVSYYSIPFKIEIKLKDFGHSVGLHFV
jgi:hypothetical protein